jgi:hypothetical protein
MMVLHLLARCWPKPTTPGADLRHAVSFLGWDVSPAIMVRAGNGLALVIGSGGALVAWLAPFSPGIVAWCFLAAFAVGARFLVTAGPELLARLRRSAALGAAPELVVMAVLRMRLAPSPERAAAFAADASDGHLARSLAAHARAGRTAGRSGLETFGEEWASWFPGLGRALGLVAAAGRESPADRDRSLDRALAAVLEGTEERTREFAGSIRGPTTALYAFGVLLPTALVSLLPAGRASGLAVSTANVVVVYDVALPLVLLAASTWLLSRRPVAFPTRAVGPGHPAVPDRQWLAVAAGLVAGGVTAVVTAMVLPPWTSLVATPGIAVGVVLVVRYRPCEGVHADVADREAGLADVLSIVGRRVARGTSVERAIESAAAERDDATGSLLARGAARQARLGIGIERAFLGPAGPLARVPSSRLRGVVTMLAVAAREGRPAGSALRAMADHLDELDRVERETRTALRPVVGTLRSTGAYFGPLVGGATVALSGHLDPSSLPGNASSGLAWLGPAVGGYVLALAVILTTLSVGLDRGLEPALVASRVGTGLLAATASFLGGYAVAAAVA